ncbi:Alanine racemase, biosynthetic [compost metagenome]
MTEQTDFDSDETYLDDFDIAPVRLTVDLGALVDNWKEMARRSGRASTAAVVKADAYGLGLEDCGTALYEAGARDFFVAAVQEGVTLRTYAPYARIYVLSGIWPGQERMFYENDLVPVIISEEQLAFWMSVTAEHGDHPCALHIDTGFNRLGLPAEEAIAFAEDVSRPASFSPVLVMSHLHSGDSPASPLNRSQLESFQRVATAFEGVPTSLSASAGIFLGPEYHFDLTRPGIAAYGGEAVNGMQALKPVAKAEARIIQIRDAPSGSTVSYGATHQLSRNSRLAVVSAGYADGYLRSLSGSGVPLRAGGAPGAFGFIANRRVPVIGRVTMDLTIFDVTDVPENEIRTGDYIELFGPNIALDDAARAGGTIGYELLTALGLRYERRYIYPDD